MIWIIVISFFLESIFSNFVNISSIFIPLFTITALVTIFPYFNVEKEYIKMCLLFGFLYDIVFTNTLFINLVLFTLIYFVTKILNYYLANNLVNNFIMLFINILFYRCFIYFIYVLSGTLSFNTFYLFKSIYSSLIINFIYSIVLYFVIEKFVLKKKKRFY